MDAHAHAEDSHGSHSSPRTYVVVWIALIIGTFLTFTVARGEHHAWTLPLALAIATTKATLVVLFFMHLWGDKGLPKFVLLTAVVLLTILISLVLTDLHFRFPLVTPRAIDVYVPPR